MVGHAVGARVRVMVAATPGKPDLTGTILHAEERPWGAEYCVGFDPGQWYASKWAWITADAVITADGVAPTPDPAARGAPFPPGALTT